MCRPVWEREMSMYGERMTVNDLVEVIRVCRSKCPLPLLKGFTDTPYRQTVD